MSTNDELGAIESSADAAKQSFELERLSAYLREHIGPFNGVLGVKQFSGGQSNPTYLLTAGRDRYVLRRKPAGELLPSAHAVEREYKVMKALANSQVPVPRVHLLCEDPSIIGTTFVIMEYLEGRNFLDPTLPGIPSGERSALYAELNRVLAALHTIDYRAIGLEDYGRTGNYMARQIARWSRQYREVATEPIEAMQRLMEWLPEHVPQGDETSIVHGDFRIDNVIFHSTEPRIIGVLDWELSTLGHPLADFAYHMMTWRVTPDEFRGLRGADLPALGIPSERAYMDAYSRRTGRASLEGWDYFMAFNMFRMAAILQGILSRAIQGNAASTDAISTGRRARPMAEAGWRLVQQLGGPS